MRVFDVSHNRKRTKQRATSKYGGMTVIRALFFPGC